LPLAIEADDRQRTGRGDILTWRKIWRRAIRRDREDQLDFADIGGKANATTHARQYGLDTGASEALFDQRRGRCSLRTQGAFPAKVNRSISQKMTMDLTDENIRARRLG
jgi:hypothetical protein